MDTPNKNATSSPSAPSNQPESTRTPFEARVARAFTNRKEIFSARGLNIPAFTHANVSTLDQLLEQKYPDGNVDAIFTAFAGVACAVLTPSEFDAILGTALVAVGTQIKHQNDATNSIEMLEKLLTAALGSA